MLQAITQWDYRGFYNTYDKQNPLQWTISGALLLNLIITAVTLFYCSCVERYASLRMFMEENRLRFYICVAIHLVFWFWQVSSRIKLDGKSKTESRIMQVGMFNIFCMSLIYS